MPRKTWTRKEARHELASLVDGFGFRTDLPSTERMRQGSTKDAPQSSVYFGLYDVTRRASAGVGLIVHPVEFRRSLTGAKLSVFTERRDDSPQVRTIIIPPEGRIDLGYLPHKVSYTFSIQKPAEIKGLWKLLSRPGRQRLLAHALALLESTTEADEWCCQPNGETLRQFVDAVVSNPEHPGFRYEYVMRQTTPSLFVEAMRYFLPLIVDELRPYLNLYGVPAGFDELVPEFLVDMPEQFGEDLEQLAVDFYRLLRVRAEIAS